MAGSISLSLSQQFNALGKPLAGGKLYTFAAGTTTPQDAFKDSNLTLEHPNPIILDSSGRVPAFYLADGNIKIRLTDSAGVTQISADNLLVVGPSSGSASGDTVDATTILATGDIKTRYGTGALTGFVRLNGRTIGSATSGASERANSDAQDLFEYLWGADANLSVSTGRGLTANADWVANKALTLPDGRGRVLAALDDMGNSAAGRLTSSYFGTAATALGAVGGSESHTLTLAQLAAHDHGGVTGSTTPTSTLYGASSSNAPPTTTAGGGSAYNAMANNDATPDLVTISAHTHTITSAGSGNAHNNVQPTLLVTNYIKL